MSFQKFCLTLLIGLLVCGGELIAQEVNSAFTSWNKHGVGTSITLQMKTLQNGKVLSETKQILKLIAKAEDKVTVQIVTSAVNNGMVSTGATFEMPIPKVLPKPAEVAVDPKQPKPEIKSTKGKETIKVVGEEVECEWFQTETTIGGVATVSKQWMSNEVPGLTVKAKVTMSNGLTTDTMVVDQKIIQPDK